MGANRIPIINTGFTKGDSGLAQRLRREIEGEVLFDAFSRGRYSTDASHYQIEPLGVVVAKTEQDVRTAMEIAAEEGIPLLPRGGGTSQCGQTIGEALIVDVSKHLNKVIDFDAEAGTAAVEPGIALDQLNAFLNPHGYMFTVDVSTSSRATIGGMTGNNSCGARSIRYGTMRDNVRAIDALLTDGSEYRFGELPGDLSDSGLPSGYRDLATTLLKLGEREAEEIFARFPRLMRRVGGYNIDALVPGASNHPGGGQPNLAHLLVGSEGTLAFSTRVHLGLHRQPKHKVLGICHFPTFYGAMESTQHIVKLHPAAVELVDRNMMDLARDIDMFRPTIEKFVQGEPDSLLLVEFAGDELEPQLAKLRDLNTLMGDLGYPNAVVDATTGPDQSEFWNVRKSGLNIMMSMKGDGKPISFIEDCAVPLEDLAEYTDRLTNVFTKYGTKGTWYAHASVGCLHVRPVVNLKEDTGAGTMRAIAEEAFEMVREYKGSHSGEHGDGIVRSEFHRPMFGDRMIDNFEEVKDIFDPNGIMNPGKIVHPPKFDDRSLLRFKPGYESLKLDTALDWSEWGGLGGAVEMCNNNGACRKFDAGVMCPSFRATQDEQHLVRGRANTLRLALSGQLGEDAFTSDEMHETMELCVGCKGCKRECPTGVDMSRMKTEFLYHYNRRHGLSLRDKLVAYLPRYAPWASKFPWLANLRDAIPGLAKLSEAIAGLSAKRTLPNWRGDAFDVRTQHAGPTDGTPVVILADTFNTYFEPENLIAATRVLASAGYRVEFAKAPKGERPLCCGRTFLAAGLVDEARAEATRTIEALKPHVEAGTPIIGLEPSCLLTLRDEFSAMLPGSDSEALARQAMLFEEFIAQEADAGRLNLNLQPTPQKRALLHGHCHQKAFAVMGSVEKTLRLVPELDVETVTSSCCGMAGAFGYQKETYDVSMRMAEASLLPAVRDESSDSYIVADGTSCRHQIHDGAERDAVHVARVLADALQTN
ncbi:MAG: FAD-binding protein [Alphaproteobacteria bacterium]|nr:FAD-binding protein [Alphaproteobacteria bacterium]